MTEMSVFDFMERNFPFLVVGYIAVVAGAIVLASWIDKHRHRDGRDDEFGGFGGFCGMGGLAV